MTTAMVEIDLNADVGEGCGTDEALLELVSSANIACGWHAGDARTMRACVRAALAQGVAIGAHPSFPDREHFGRRPMQVPADELRAGVLYQIGALEAIARAEGGRLAHVKPHGALYNQAARDPALAEVIVAAVRDFDPQLALYCLAGSRCAQLARAAGLCVVEEAFADRAYRADGSLVPRDEPGALIEDVDTMLARVLEMLRHRRVTTREGDSIPLSVQTICLHGDGAQAIALARALRQALLEHGVRIRAPCHRDTV